MFGIGKNSDSSSSRRTLFQKLSIYFILIFLGFIVADLSILSFRDLMIPQQAPPKSPPRPKQQSYNPRSTYSSITNRNIFNSDGTIPDPLVGKNEEPRSNMSDNEPVPSQLPLNLIGTIVHSNPKKSIANIEVKGKNMVVALAPGKDIERIATLIKVERNKIVIRNLNNQRLEYIDNRQSTKLSFSAAKTPMPTGVGRIVPSGNEVRQLGQNKFEINRNDIDKYTKDMSGLLMQASTVPRKKPNGEIECFVLTGFQPGSIYQQLSLQAGDCIKTVNGEPIDSPAKALELYNALRNSTTIKLSVERDGKDTDLDYNIK